MKDLPAIVWIIGAFVVLATGTFIYSRSGPPPLPNVLNIWEHVEGFRDNLKYRRLALTPGASRERIAPPYKIVVSRATDQTFRATNIARYILGFEVTGTYPASKPWGSARLDIGLIDTSTSEAIGNVKLVSIHKAEIKN